MGGGIFFELKEEKTLPIIEKWKPEHQGGCSYRIVEADQKYCIGCISGSERAHLAAAAPELYRKLKEVFDLLENQQPIWYLRKHYNSMSAVLAIAEGRTQDA
jgi:hypothetical protein